MNKQIEEMAFDLCLIDRCKHLPREECHKTTCAHCEAEALYNAGYRKQNEVAEEIFAEIEKFTYRYLNDADYSGGDLIYDLSEIKKKYTEVEK